MRQGEIDVYAPCRCGSGRKYKFCCLQKDRKAKAKRLGKAWYQPRQPSKDDRRVVVMDLEEGERLNSEGMRQLNSRKFAQAEQCFRGAIAAAPLVPTAYNNLALVLFLQGHIDEAIRVQETILRESPMENVFGMSNLVLLYLTAGRQDEAEAVAEDALRLKPMNISALGKQCEALARLKRHQDIFDAVERYPGDTDWHVDYFAAMAAANLGLFDRALDRLRRVGRGNPLASRAEKYVRLIKAGRGPDTIEGDWPYFEAQDILPREVFERLLRDGKKSAPAAAGLINNPVIVDAFAALLSESGGSGSDKDIVRLLGDMTHPRAVELLERIAGGTFGSDDLRLYAMRTLVAKGVWDADPRKIWVRGEWTEVKTLIAEVTPEAESIPPPEGLFPLYEAAMVASNRGRWKEGEKLWREFIDQAPAFHPAYHNLAVALIEQEGDAEAEAHLRKAMELDPKYVFAPCTLAMLFLRQGRVAEARELLGKVVLPQKVHPAAMATYCAAQTQVAIAEGGREAAFRWLDMAARADPKNPLVKELRKHLRIPRPAAKALEKLGKKAERKKQI